MPLKPPAVLSPLLARPIAVFGAGVSGQGAGALAAALGVAARVYDARGNAFTPASVEDHQLVVFSPGFAPDHPWLVQARAAGLECLGELDFAAACWSGRIIAITGTNGKTTLTEFLTHALATSGCRAHATGNIGLSFSNLVAEFKGGTPRDIAVCEVSSFQAETFRTFRADATLWTNFAEDHLERHPGLEAYFRAKWRLVERTVPADAPPPPAEAGFCRHAAGAFVGTSVRTCAEQFRYWLDNVTCVETQCQPADPALAGTVFAEYPQRENFVLARAWWRAAEFPEAGLYAAARSFQLGRHRLARVGQAGGVTYWNDSKATNFHAVEAALLRFNTPVVLIAGGKSKGGDLRGFVRRISGRVHHVLLIGATADELATYCREAGVSFTEAGTLAGAVPLAARLTPAGGHVLLSPGFASFDQFRSYEDRGEQFEGLVRNLAVPAGAPKPQTASNLR